VSKLWSIYEKLYKFTGEHEELCRKYPGIFLYMYDVMEKKHNGCDEAEKENAWKLWENTKFMCQNFNCMEDPEWPKYTGEEEEEEEGSGQGRLYIPWVHGVNLFLYLLFVLHRHIIGKKFCFCIIVNQHIFCNF